MPPLRAHPLLVVSKDAERRGEALRAHYIAQLPEKVAAFESQILAWPVGGSVPKELSRKIHSLKGSAGGYGLKFVTDVCHRLEDLLAKHSPEEDHQLYIDALLRYVDLISDYAATVANSEGKADADFATRLHDLAGHSAAPRSRMLIVEPGLSMARALRRLLESHGVATSKSSSGYEALGLLLQDNYDAVLTSYETADISGLSLAKAVRAIDEISRELKIILVTSNNLEQLSPAVNRVVRKDRDIATTLIESLRAENLVE